MQKSYIIKDLEKKMVFLAGPRQAGKTWLAQDIEQHFDNPTYLNFDIPNDRQVIQEQGWMPETDLLILDELHKMPKWKNYLKGLYDDKAPQLKILVTGSARLDIFRQAGDALAGRYFLHRLLPLSPAELRQLNQPASISRLTSRSGFPEPWLTDDIVEVKRWRAQYLNSLITTEAIDFANIRNLRALQLTLDLLRSRVGSPVSYQSIARDINASPSTVAKYVQLFEALYLVFRVTPYSNNIARSLLKEPKIYFFDSGLVEGDAGAKLENLIAVCLLKHTYAQTDYLGENSQLHYLRTKEGLEVDFALVKNREIEKIIEVKSSDTQISKPLHYFADKYQLPAVQLVKHARNNITRQGIDIIKAQDFLQELYL